MDSRCAHGNMAVNGHSRSIARDPSPIADYEQFDEVSLIGKCFPFFFQNPFSVDESL